MTIKRDVFNFTKRVEREVKSSVNKRVLTELGRLAIKLIQKRTRRGLGLVENGRRPKKFRGLTEAYIAQRRRSKDLNRRLTSPAKSNLTFTGALVDSIRIVSLNENTKTIEIDANKRRRKGGVTNEQIAEWLADDGREFLNLSAREQREIVDQFNRSFRTQFEKTRRRL